MVEDQEQAMGEVALAEEKHAVVELEMRELQRTRDEVMQQVEEIQEEHRQQLLPKIAQLQEVLTCFAKLSACCVRRMKPAQHRPARSAAFRLDTSGKALVLASRACR